MMLAKSAFVLRSLVVASFLGGLVACTFDQPSTDENEKASSSAIHAGKNKSADGGASKGADGGVDDSDAGPYDADGGAGWDGGYEGDDDDDLGADAGAGDNDTWEDADGGAR